MRKLAMLVGLGVFFLGCASAQIKKIDPESDAEGLRFYRPAPYLLVSISKIESNTVEYTAKIVWLPDYTHAYIINPTGTIGKADLTVGLTDGWNLTSLTLNRDASVPTVVDETVGKILELIEGERVEGLDLGPGLYRLDFDPNGRVTGLTRLAVSR